jgi:drug/metabolite transporter (DMT)-like permease
MGPTTRTRRAWWVGLGYLLVVLIWGTTWYGIHTQVNGTSPHLAVAFRMGAASVVFFAIATARRIPLRLTSFQARQVLIQGVCFFGLNYLAVYAGTQYLTSGVVAVLFSILVPLNIFVEWLLYGVRPRLVVVAAAVIGVIGIATVFSTELQRAVFSGTAVWGAVLVLFAATLVALGNVLATRLASSELSPLVINAYGTAAGTVSILLWGLISGASWSMTITTPWLIGLSYLTLIGTVLAFGIYMTILPIVGSVAGAYVAVLSPIVAIAISSVLEELPLTAATFVGAVLLLIGHSLLAARRRQ